MAQTQRTCGRAYRAARDVPGAAALSRSRLARLIAEGAVSRDGVAVTDVKARVLAGQVWRVQLEDAVDGVAEAEDIALDVTIGDAPPARLDKALARDVPGGAALSRSRLARLIAEGAVSLNGVAVTDVKARDRKSVV